MSAHNKVQWFIVSLIITISLLSGYYSYFINPHRALIADDGATQWEERMEPVKKHLPSNTKEVGYLSDNESSAIFQEHLLTSYSLAPIVVRRGGNYEWVIGNFTQPGFENIINENVTGKHEVKRFGAGIYLIHRTEP